MTKIVVAAFILAVVTVSIGVVYYPELLGVDGPRPTVTVPEAPVTAPPVAKAKAGSCCGGGESACGCAAKEVKKSGTGCGCGGPPKVEFFVMSANAVSMMASPQGQGPLLASSTWMAARPAK